MIDQQLEKVKNKTKKEISECCVYLYSLESFLYKSLNHTMRLIGDKDHENVWRSKLETLGYLSYENVTHRTGTTVCSRNHAKAEQFGNVLFVIKSENFISTYPTGTSFSN